jgi:hypothetical protein
MRSIVLLLSGILLCENLCSQIHYPDERWPLGMHEFDTVGYGNAWLYFHDNTISVIEADLQMNFEAAVAVASDTFGQVLFYSNGCEIRGADGNLLQNGEGLNPGELHDVVCGVTGYIMSRSMMALPLPESNSQWILLHEGGKNDPARKLIYGPLYYTLIDMSLNNGAGGVISKNNVLWDATEVEPFAVVRHGNGRDWWLVVPEYSTNHYLSWLLTPQGLISMPMQTAGNSLSCRKVGSTIFSPDGRRYARGQNCAAVAMNFDRCTGQLFGATFMEREPSIFGGGGMVFSDNNRWLYALSQLSLFRADLTEDSPVLDSLYKQPYILDSSIYVHATSLAYMQQAPDGKIYISSQHRERYLAAFTVTEDTFAYLHEYLPLPVPNVRTLPHFPNFRLYDLPGSACDTLGINDPTVAVEEIRKDVFFTLFPNPAEDQVTISYKLPQGSSNASLEITDQAGRVFRSIQQLSISGSMTISLTGIPAGAYLAVLRQDHQLILTEKLIIIR